MMSFTRGSSKIITSYSLLFYILTNLAINCYAVKVGVLLPLSDELSSFGKRMKNVIEFAYDKFNDRSIEIVYKDTKGNSNIAKNIYHELSKDKEFVCVIFPLLPSINEIAKYADFEKLPIITPTSKEVKLLSKYIFQVAFTKETEIKGIVEYCINERKLKNFAILYPAENVEYKETFVSCVTLLNGKIVAEEKYEKGTVDFKKQILAFGGVNPQIIKDINENDKIRFRKICKENIEEFFSLYSENEKDIKILPPKFSGKNVKKYDIDDELINIIKKTGAKYFKISSDENIKDSISCEINETKYNEQIKFEILIKLNKDDDVKSTKFVFTKSKFPKFNPLSIDAIYIPSNCLDALQIIPQLRFYNLNVVVIGSSEWFDDSLLKFEKLGIEDILIPVGFFPKDANEVIKEYQKKYGEEFDILSAISFDAASVIFSLIHNGCKSRESISNAIRNLKNFNGICGNISFNGMQYAKIIFPIITIKDNDWFRIR
jgi:ABC-type branched-subunit amino acid transport system substrate-binding protein